MRAMQPMALSYPDAAVLCVLNLKSHLDPSVRVSTDLTGWKRPQPSVHVTHRSSNNDGVVEWFRLQVDVRAELMDNVYALMDQVRALLAVLPLEDVNVAGVREYIGAQPVPDADQRPRLMLTVDVAVKGATA